MDTRTKRQVMNMAVTLAGEWFRATRESDVPELDPYDYAWQQFNETYPANAARSDTAPTPMDLLFEAAYRAEMARRWQEESERRVRSLLLSEGE